MDCQQRNCSLRLVNKMETYVQKLPARMLSASVPALLGVWLLLLVSPAVGYQPPQDEPARVQELVEQLAETDFERRESAERQLIEIGSPAVDSLVRGLIDCKPDVCSRTKRILQTCARKCDEEALFKVLAVLRIRFEVSDQRVKSTLENWTTQRRADVVARWRQRGAVVTDPYQGLNNQDIAGILNGGQLQLQIADRRQVFGIGRGGDLIQLQADTEQAEVANEPKADPETETRSTNELLRLVLAGPLEQNKKFAFNSKRGADGFEKSVAMVQNEPVTVTIGENWKGDYSVFDFAKSEPVLPINSLELQKREVNDLLLSALEGHPLKSVVLTDCTVAAGIEKTLPLGLNTLTISGGAEPTEILKAVARDTTLIRVRFANSKFGKAEALALKGFRQLTSIDLAKIDIEEEAFEGLNSLKQLRRLWIERCKFPASAFIAYRDKHRGEVGINFTAKAFLGVSSAGPAGAQFQPRQLEGACIVSMVVEGEAAERAGMKSGDEILQIGDQQIKNFEELRVVIAQFEIGEEAVIQVRRSGKELTLKAKMGTPSD